MPDTNCEWKAKRQFGDIYSKYEDADFLVESMGVFYYLKQGVTVSDVCSIAKDVVDGSLDFNCLCGFFKIVIYDKKNRTFVFFGDNSGSQFFYIDLLCNEFSDSFLKLRADRRSHFEVDFTAVCQLFCYNAILTTDTTIRGIQRTDENCYYKCNKGCIICYSKKLKPLSQIPNTNLDLVMNLLDSCTNGKKIAAVVTGGTDSRVVLSHLYSRGASPSLVITGHEGNPDLPVAKKIAASLAADLTVINPNPIATDYENDEWIKKAFLFSDGVYDTALSYRHYLKSVWVSENEFCAEYGGVGGEMYKNQFCMFVRNRLFFRPITPKLLFHTVVATTCKNREFASDVVKQQLPDVNCKLFKWVSENKEPGFLQAYNNVGYSLLKRKFSVVSNNCSFAACKIDPLMDRNLVATISKHSPIAHVLHFYHRKQIQDRAPQLSKLKTDRGLTCSLNPIWICKDALKTSFFFLMRCVARFQRKLGLKCKSSKTTYWNDDYQRAVETNLFDTAFECCKKYDVLDPNVEKKQIPIDMVGIILQVGLTLLD